MKRLLAILILLIPLFSLGQAPTSDSTKLTAPPAVTSFTPSSWYQRGSNASNAQIGYFNNINSKWYQLVTGYQFNHYTGASTLALINANTGLIPTNGLQKISGVKDSVGLGGKLTQDVTINTTGHYTVLADTLGFGSLYLNTIDTTQSEFNVGVTNGAYNEGFVASANSIQINRARNSDGNLQALYFGKSPTTGAIDGKIYFEDNVNHKGAEYTKNVNQNNFTKLSLITKGYADSTAKTIADSVKGTNTLQSITNAGNSTTNQIIARGVGVLSGSYNFGYKIDTAANLFYYKAGAGQDYINIRSSTSNHETRIGIMPNGTFVPGSVNTQIAGFKIFGTDFTTDETNNNDFGIYTTSNSNRFNSKHNGTGLAQPFVWSVQDTQYLMQATQSGFLGIGIPSSTAFTPTTRIFGNSNTSAPTTADLTNSITIGVGNVSSVNNRIGQIGFLSADADFTAPKMVAYIQAIATETYADNTGTGSTMHFFTGTNAGTNPTDRGMFDNLGNFIVNGLTASKPIYTSSIKGLTNTGPGTSSQIQFADGSFATSSGDVTNVAGVFTVGKFSGKALPTATYQSTTGTTTDSVGFYSSQKHVSKAVHAANGISLAQTANDWTIGLGAITPTSTNGVSAATMAFVDPTSSIQGQLNAKVPANPTALAGKTAINGTAITYKRSDASSAIDTTAATGFVTGTGLNSRIYQAKGIATLSSGVSIISNANITATSHAFVTLVSIGGTVTTTWQYLVQCSSGQLIIAATTTANTTNTADTSTLNYIVIP